MKKKWKKITMIFVSVLLIGSGSASGIQAAAATKTAKGFIEHCRAQLDMFYWYGTYGQVATLDLLKQKKIQYPSQYSRERYEYAKNNHINKNKRVYDCTGLIKSYWMQPNPTAKPVYAQAYDKNVDGLYRICGRRGKIESLPEVAGVLVFVEYENLPGQMKHVGVYIGGGQVIEARGFYYGVVKTSLRSRPWTHWGFLPESWLQGGLKQEPLSNETWSANESDVPSPGACVRIKKGATEYYPGLRMPEWVREEVYTVAKTTGKSGAPVIYGGKRCVLLKEVQTWCDVGILQVV